MPKRRDWYVAGAGIAGVGLAAWRTYFPWIGDDIKTLRLITKAYKRVFEKVSNERYLIDTFEEHVRQTPGKAFMLFEDRVYTYSYMDQMANKVANLVMSWKIPIGETVAIMIENEPAFVWTFLGLQKVGLAAAMINYHLTGQPLTHSIKAGSPKALIIGQTSPFLDAIMDIRSNLPSDLPIYVQGRSQNDLPEGYLSMDDELIHSLPVPVARAYRKDVTPLSPLCYIYTSGTTGLPKPAIINQTKAMAVGSMFKLFDYDSNDTVYVVTPLYHSSATHLGFFNTIDAGATFALRRKFSARHYWEDVRKYNVTVLLYIGELCRYLLAVPQHPEDGDHKVRCAIGNGLRKDIWTEYKTRFKIPEIYEFIGATEGTGSFINVCNRVGSIGRLSPFMRWVFGKNIDTVIVKYDQDTNEPLRDANGHCMHIGPGEQGLMISVVPPSHTGFYRGPKEMDDKKTIRDAFVKGDAWFNFGDAVYMDKDYNIYFRDRTGDTFRWKSENVSTAEVANAISGLDFIRDVNVYGVEVPGADGKAGMAAVMLKNEYTVNEKLLKKLYKHCERELPFYARPLFLRFMTEFIITQTMKNRKVELVKEAYDPFEVKDALYVIDPQNKSYKPLTKANYQQVINSKL
ncbi:hypothetical protein FSP39_014187 [Pinctada imbricata]|uniref:long-chain-fatty-acid--CoA ligase n=1 Tax=Pinctada imbricata TaxID=66713 RepID=A0AA89BVN8_PINIB|nr:hypothetical protein FSP39_014187 [Pinctada imbricata]